MPFSHTPSVTQFRLTDDKAGPYGIAAGPDGALWLTLVHRGSVARLTLDGAFEEYALDAADCRPTVIAAARTARCGSPASRTTASVASPRTAR